MTLAVDIDALLDAVNTVAAGVSGIRHAYDYDEWPDSPPGLFNKSQAMHLTGFPEEGDGWVVRSLGIDMDEVEILVPMYTVVLAAAQVRRSRSWVAPYPDRYRIAFADAILLNGAIAAGSAMYEGSTVVRAIPDWDGYDGFYMLRHRLRLHVKGHQTHGV